MVRRRRDEASQLFGRLGRERAGPARIDGAGALRTTVTDARRGAPRSAARHREGPPRERWYSPRVPPSTPSRRARSRGARSRRRRSRAAPRTPIPRIGRRGTSSHSDDELRSLESPPRRRHAVAHFPQKRAHRLRLEPPPEVVDRDDRRNRGEGEEAERMEEHGAGAIVSLAARDAYTPRLSFRVEIRVDGGSLRRSCDWLSPQVLPGVLQECVRQRDERPAHPVARREPRQLQHRAVLAEAAPREQRIRRLFVGIVWIPKSSFKL